MLDKVARFKDEISEIASKEAYFEKQCKSGLLTTTKVNKRLEKIEFIRTTTSISPTQEKELHKETLNLKKSLEFTD